MAQAKRYFEEALALDPTWVPHAVAVGVESDREYGVAVLRALRSELNRRANAFKRAGVTKLSELRRAAPRTASADCTPWPWAGRPRGWNSTSASNCWRPRATPYPGTAIAT